MLNMLLSLRTFTGENVKYNLCTEPCHVQCPVCSVRCAGRLRSEIQSDLSPLLPPQPNLLSDAAPAYNAAPLIVVAIIMIIFIMIIKIVIFL